MERSENEGRWQGHEEERSGGKCICDVKTGTSMGRNEVSAAADLYAPEIDHSQDGFFWSSSADPAAMRWLDAPLSRYE